MDSYYYWAPKFFLGKNMPLKKKIHEGMRQGNKNCGSMSSLKQEDSLCFQEGGSREREGKRKRGGISR